MLRIFFQLLCCLVVFSLSAQDTFSIVAVDTETGEVGSAGASCLDESAIAGGVQIISDVLPGKGAIHTQSFWLAANQQNARTRMEAGDSPEEIMTWLISNDVQGNSGSRQYGAVDFDGDGNARAAAFTGDECFDYKGQIVGDYYAIQGNILLGPEILDSMEARFLNTSGSLAERLMAALQGANVPGADSRCLNEGVSSLSAFVRVARPEDTANNFYLDLLVPSTPFGVEPIDSLQTLFDNWLLTTNVTEVQAEAGIRVFPNPVQDHFVVNLEKELLDQPLLLQILDINGRVVYQQALQEQSTRVEKDRLEAGNIFFYQIRDQSSRVLHSGKLLLSEN